MHQILRKKSQHGLQVAAVILEGVLTWTVLASIIIYGIYLIKSYFFCLPSPLSKPDGFQSFFADLLILVIGIEFIKTFTNRSPESVMEILLFAITRQILLSHGGMLDTLVGCVSVILLIVAHYFWRIHNTRQETADIDGLLKLSPQHSENASIQ